MEETEFYLSLGSNCGDRRKNVTSAMEYVQGIITVTGCSSIYETPEIHGLDRLYYNAVLRGATNMDYDDFNRLLKSFEIAAGRDEECRLKGDVPVDIDIVIWNGSVVRPKDFAQDFFRIGYREISR